MGHQIQMQNLRTGLTFGQILKTELSLESLEQAPDIVFSHILEIGNSFDRYISGQAEDNRSSESSLEFRLYQALPLFG